MKEITATHHYPATVDDIFAFFSDDDTVKEKHEALGARNVEILSIEEQKDALVCKTSREVPSDVPGALKTFLGSYNKVVQTEYWNEESDGALVCKFDVHIEGVPVKVVGNMRLSATDEGSVNEVSIKISSDVLFVGKKLAEFIAKDSQKSVESEYQYIKQRCTE